MYYTNTCSNFSHNLGKHENVAVSTIYKIPLFHLMIKLYSAVINIPLMVYIEFCCSLILN